jgi:hypothetical protein
MSAQASTASVHSARPLSTVMACSTGGTVGGGDSRAVQGG